MRVGRRAAVALVAAAVVALGASGATAAPPRAVREPTPVEATAAAGDLLRAVADKASEIQSAVGAPAPARKASLTDDEVTGIARTSAKLQDWIRGRKISRTALDYDAKTGLHTYWVVSKDSAGRETVEAQVFVSDESGQITEVRTGPQVAWMMARALTGRSAGRSTGRPSGWRSAPCS